MNIHKAIHNRKSLDDDNWWDSFLSTLTIILSTCSKLTESPHHHTAIETASVTIRTLIDARLQSSYTKQRTDYIIQREADVFVESIQYVQQLALHHHPAYQTQLTILTNHADRLVDALMTYSIGDLSWQLDELLLYSDIKKSDVRNPSPDSVGRKLMRTITSLRNQHHRQHKDRRHLNPRHHAATRPLRSTKTSLMNLFTAHKSSSRSSLRDLFQSTKKREELVIDNDSGIMSEAILPEKLYDSFYPSQNSLSQCKRGIKTRRSSPSMSCSSSPPPSLHHSSTTTSMTQRRKSLVLSYDHLSTATIDPSLSLSVSATSESSPAQQPSPPPVAPLTSPCLPLSPSQHYYDDPFFFNDISSAYSTKEPFPKSKAPTICSTVSSYFSAKSSSLHSLLDIPSSADLQPLRQDEDENKDKDDKYEVEEEEEKEERLSIVQDLNSSDDQPRHQNEKSPSSTLVSNTIRQLSGPPPLHQPGQPKKSRQKDGSFLYHVFDKEGRTIIVLEIIAGKPQIVAATKEQLFLKLADESPQDFDYVDAYLLNHLSFMTDEELFDHLVARFHLEPSLGHEDYFQQWQRRIQLKILYVLARWVKLQYSDFLRDVSLLLRLEDFCDHDMRSAGFLTESTMIKESIYTQRHDYSVLHYNNDVIPFSSLTNAMRSTSGPISLFSIANTTPPDSPVIPVQRHQHYSHPWSSYQHQHQHPHHFHYQLHNHSPTSPHLQQQPSNQVSVFLTVDAKHIAKYLTLADYHLLKLIQPRDYLDGHWRDIQYNECSFAEVEAKGDIIGILTKRSNMMNHWVIHELTAAKTMKQRRTILRRLIETSKLCLEWNNFHTSMVLTMGLLSHPVQKMEETWQSLSSREKATFSTLEKLVDVSHNMAHYRQALQEGLHPGLFNKRRRSPTNPAFMATSTENMTSTAAIITTSQNNACLKDNASFTGSSSTSSSSAISSPTFLSSATNTMPTLLFFPMILKDLTFLIDGNPTAYNQRQRPTMTQGNNKNEDHSDKRNSDAGNNDERSSIDNDDDDDLINFSKFYGLAQYITKVIRAIKGTYWFAAELETFPFLPKPPVEQVSSHYSTPTTANCIPCSSTRSSISTFSSSTVPDHHHQHIISPSPSTTSTSSFFMKYQHQSQQQYYYHQHYHGAGTTQKQSYHHHSTPSSSLDAAAILIEQRIIGVSFCYDDPQCEAQLVNQLKASL